MGQSWCKVSAQLDSHPKVRRAGNLGRQVFEFALRRNAELDRNGVIPAEHLESEYLADVLMLTKEDAASGLSRAVRTGLLAQDGDDFVIAGWDDEWGKRPMTEAERKRNQRARSSNEKAKTAKTDSGHEMSRDDRDCPDSHGSEERRSEEKRGDQIGLSDRAETARPRQDSDAPRPPKKPRTRKASAIPMPDGWEPRPQEIAQATAKGLSADAERESFVDHHTAKGSVFVDWNAAFRTWIGNAVKFANGTQNGRRGPQPRTLFEAAMESAREAEAREREGKP